MNSWLQNHPKKSLLLINFVLIGAILLIVESVLHKNFPYYTSIKPLIQPDNYYKYGWGNFPKEKIFVFNVDTGEREWQRVNNKGWRDHNRQFKKDKGTYRILMLGDSEMYGSLVTNDERFPILLENQLQKDYKIEVISLSFYGWGTDQMLEALRLDGLKYDPDYVILQFNQNDVYDNIAFQLIKELVGIDSVKLDFKPFYHTLDEQGEIVRHKNPYFNPPTKKHTAVKFKKTILQHSEIAKRLYGLILSKKNRLYNEIGRSYFDPKNIPLSANDLRLLHLKTVLELNDSSALIQALKPLADQTFYQEKLDSIVASTTNYNTDTAVIIKTILEDLYFQDFWVPEIYRPEPPDPTSRQWKMYYKMLEQVKLVTDSMQIPLAVFPVVEKGSVNFTIDRYWMYPDSVYIENALMPNKLVEEYCKKNDIEFIPINQPLQRARNDIHMNEIGNATLANELYNYLVNEKAEILKEYRKKN